MTGNPLYDQLLATVGASLIDKGIVKAASFFGSRPDASIENEIVDKLKEYSDKVMTRCGYITSLALGGAEIEIREIYQPLTVSLESQSFQIDSFPTRMLEEFPKIFIEDTAGMGKSTISKFMTITAIEDSQVIPIFLELRKIRHDVDIIGNMAIDVFGIDSEDTRSMIEKILRNKNSVCILDGFDEVARESFEGVARSISDFNESYPDCWVIITSRPHSGMRSLKGFHRGVIDRLSSEQALELIKRYDRSNKYYDFIAKEVNSGRIGEIKEFLGNPLLVSLLYRVFIHKGAIPFEKYVYYQQVYEALYEDHDLSKGDIYRHGKVCGLSLMELQKVMRALAITFSAKGVATFSRELLISELEESKKLIPKITYSSESVFEDVISTVPLIIKDGLDYKWNHKSLQDYFAASFLCYESEPKTSKSILVSFLKRNNIGFYLNILDFYYEMSERNFRSLFLSPALKSYLEFEEKVLSSQLSSAQKEFCLSGFLNGAYYIFSRTIDGTNYGLNSMLSTGAHHDSITSLHLRYGNYINPEYYIVNVAARRNVRLIKKVVESNSSKSPEFYRKVSRDHLKLVNDLGGEIKLDPWNLIELGNQGLQVLYRRLKNSVFEDRYVLNSDVCREMIEEIEDEGRTVGDAIAGILGGTE